MFQNLILDCYHGNEIPDFRAARDAGLVGVIHKATEGTDFTDSAYVARRATVRNLGMLWGAYHFGHLGDPVGQVNHFLSVVGDDATTLLCLDLERALDGEVMSIPDAEIFVLAIKDRTGRWPVVYTAKWVLDTINPLGKETLLSQCPLWVASYASAPILPAVEWDTWTLWQFTNGQSGPAPHTLPGLGRNDLDVFNGTLDQLKAFWKGTNVASNPPSGLDAFMNALRGIGPTANLNVSIADPSTDPLLVYSFPRRSVSITVAKTTTLWAADMDKNVRGTPAGKVVGSLKKGQSVDVNMDALVTNIDTHKWGMIVSANFLGEWIATDVLSASRP